MEDYKVSEEVAVSELKDFVGKYNRKQMDDEQIKELYPDVIEAIQTGNIVFDSGEPTLKLIDPIKNQEGEISVSEVKFRTRIVPSEQRKLSTGLDLKKDGLLFGHKCMAYIVNQPIAMLDKFSLADYRIIEQLSTVFM